MTYVEIWLSAVKGLAFILAAFGAFLGLLCLSFRLFIRSPATERLADSGFWVLIVSVILALMSLL